MSVVLSVTLSLVFAWLVFSAKGPIPRGGGAGIAVDLIPTTFMIVLITTVALSPLTRARVRRGAIGPLDRDGPATRRDARVARRLPRRVVVLTLAVGASVVLMPITWGS